MSQGKTLNIDSLIAILQKKREEGQRIVTTNGCFDLLHVGHLRYLQAAREMGDLLVVLINSDISVKSLKGPTRPIVPEDERSEMLAGLTCVDYVIKFDEETPIRLLKQIKPHIHVKGGDYNDENLPEAATLKEMGTQLAFIPMIEGRSTSCLIKRIQETTSPASSHAAS